MKPKTTEATLRKLREELGMIRSCALMMAHTQSAQARTTHLKTLSEKLTAMDAVLARLQEELPAVLGADRAQST
jgi:hypothetical protein